MLYYYWSGRQGLQKCLGRNEMAGSWSEGKVVEGGQWGSVCVPGRSITIHYLQEGADGAQHTLPDPHRTYIFLAAIAAAALFLKRSTWAAQHFHRHSPTPFLTHCNSLLSLL